MNRAGGFPSGLGRQARGFWEKVAKRPDGCWVWCGYLDKDGAGKFCTRTDGKQITERAPVHAWRELIGPIPEGHALLAVVCWNRRCVNPAHRMAIPHRDIVRWICALSRPIDRADTRGEMSGKAKLRDDDVRFIKAQPNDYGMVPLLATMYGVSRVTIAKIRGGASWRHVLRGNVKDRLTIHELRELLAARDQQESIDDQAAARPGAA